MKCSKRQFKSFERAEGYALEISMQNKEIGHPDVKPYKCHNCGKWHLTSKSGLTKTQKDNLKREREFIATESEYWNSYFNK